MGKVLHDNVINIPVIVWLNVKGAGMTVRQIHLPLDYMADKCNWP